MIKTSANGPTLEGAIKERDDFAFQLSEALRNNDLISKAREVD